MTHGSLGKRTRAFEDIAEQMGITLKQIHYLFAIRFVESEYRCFINFMHDYGAIVEYLKHFLTLVGEDSTKKCEVRGWLRKLNECKFVAVMLMPVDVHLQSKM